jgi:hypothetical protein
MPNRRPKPLALFAAILLTLSPLARGAGDDRVVLLTIDGFRWQEVFGGAQEALLDKKAGGVHELEGLKKRYWRDTPEARREALMPFLWTTVAKQGQIFGDPSRNARAQLTNGRKFSYPGYHEILCGFPDERIDSNDPVPNPNVNVLEWLNRRPGFEGKVSAYGTWDVFYAILNEGRSKLRITAGFRPITDEPLTEAERVINDLLPDLPRQWPDNAYDFVTARGALEHLRKRKPRVLYVGFGETDEWAHARRYDCYLDAVNKNDAFLKALWDALQSIPGYAGHTSLVVTTDHGRGSTKQDWTDHGKDTEGAEFIWIAVLGPRTPPTGLRENIEVTQGQVAATIAALVGEDYHASAPRSAPSLPGAVSAAATSSSR